ncbi:MAG: hypothetical protein D6794_07200 [Deltaproteobacteria bacterium]|nr:MAG: hypothetical protein D6794_07200 [Deltaproteobacteria bacterium]
MFTGLATPFFFAFQQRANQRQRWEQYRPLLYSVIVTVSIWTIPWVANFLIKNVTDRNMTIIIPSIVLLMGLGLRALPKPTHIILPWILVLGAPHLYPTATSNGPYREIVGAMSESYQPDSVLITEFNTAWQWLMPAVYTLMDFEPIEMPKGQMIHLIDRDDRAHSHGPPDRLANVYRTFNENQINDLTQSHRQLWVLQQGGGNSHHGDLTQWLNNHYAQIRQNAWEDGYLTRYTLTEYARVPDGASLMLKADDNFELWAWSLNDSVDVLPCQSITVESWWQIAQSNDNPYNIMLILADDNGQVAINEQPPANLFTTEWEANRYYRDGNTLTITDNLPRPSWGQRAGNVFPPLVALAYWGISFILWLFSPRNPATRRFFTLGQLAALLLAAGSLDTYGVFWGAPLYQAAFILITPAALHFFATFPQQKISAHLQKTLWGAYLLAAILTVWGTAAYLNPQIPKVRFVSIFFLVGVLLSIALFYWHFTQAPPATRQRQRLIVTGMIASIAPLLLLYIIPSLMGYRPLIGHNLAFGFLALFPVFVIYAVRQGELGNIDGLLNRTLVRLLLVSLLAAVYGILFSWFDRQLARSDISLPLVATLLAILMSLSFNPLQRLLQAWVDRLLYHGWYDYRRVVGQTGDELADTEDPQELAHTLLTSVTTTMKLRCACFLFYDSDTPSDNPIFLRAPQGCPLTAFSRPRLPGDTPFYETLSRLNAPERTAALQRAIPISMRSPVESALLGCPHTRIWIPVQASAGASRTTAMLIVGPKPGDDPFDPEDIAIFQTLARQTALVIRNIGLLARLRRREREVVHLYKDLTYAREAERKRIARELHDNIIQNIHIIYRSIKDRRVLPPEQAEAHLDESAQWLQNTMNDIRRMCNDLHPAVLDVLGLADAIRSHVDRFQQRTGIPAYLAISGDEDIPLPEQTEIMLFRICQEALWNAEKHAQATQVSVHLKYPQDDTQTVTLRVQDDGKGFDVAGALAAGIQHNTYGLLNMQERAAMVGGNLHITSTPGRGTAIEAVVPCRPEPPES